jgi:hypothetical protein
LSPQSLSSIILLPLSFPNGLHLPCSFSPTSVRRHNPEQERRRVEFVNFILNVVIGFSEFI